MPPSDISLTVHLQPADRIVRVPAGATALAAIRTAGIELVTVCGGIGICGSCKISLVDGFLSEPTLDEQMELDPEDLASGYRLACQASIHSDVTIDIPPSSVSISQHLLLDGAEHDLSIDPPVIPLDLQAQPPALDDLRADDRRIFDAILQPGISRPHISGEVLAETAQTLRYMAWQGRLALRTDTRGTEIVSAVAKGACLAATAFDIGSTTLAGYLIDLESGVVVARAGEMNPQIAFGEDIVSRIAYANQSEQHRMMLRTRMVTTLDKMISHLCESAGYSREQIVEVVAVGNTAMTHLFAGLPVRQLGEAPYLPVSSTPLVFRAPVLGFNLRPGVYVYLPANIAGYVGSDHVAALLATRTAEVSDPVVTLDIGTNTEISLSTGSRVLTCSCASGPAFEGARIRHGIRAVPGTIDRVHFRNDAFHYTTISSLPPVGICGSGILDAVAAMCDARVIDARGVFQSESLFVSRSSGSLSFVLAEASDAGQDRSILVTRRDVNEIQLAKGAIRAGLETLMMEANVSPDDILTYYLAGAFGTYLNIRSAIRIGMFPDVPEERFKQVGNAAGMGALLLATSREKRREAAELAERIEYIELTTHPAFTEAFVKALYF